MALKDRGNLQKRSSSLLPSPLVIALSPLVDNMLPRKSHEERVLLPKSLIPLLRSLHDLKPTSWYAELEAIHSLVPAKDWKDLRAYYTPNFKQYNEGLSAKKTLDATVHGRALAAFDGYMSERAGFPLRCLR